MTLAQGPALVWCPFPDGDSATIVAKTLLDERLIACANIVPAMRSLFNWDGEPGEATEAGMLLKTDAALLDAAIARLAELPPYEEPAVLGWPCSASTPGTRAWLGALAR